MGVILNLVFSHYFPGIASLSGWCHSFRRQGDVSSALPHLVHSTSPQGGCRCFPSNEGFQAPAAPCRAYSQHPNSWTPSPAPAQLHGDSCPSPGLFMTASLLTGRRQHSATQGEEERLTLGIQPACVPFCEAPHFPAEGMCPASRRLVSHAWRE